MTASIRNMSRWCRIVFPALLGILLIAASAAGFENTTKLRVTDEAAAARLKPDPSSQILRQFPLGAMLEATKKVGEWYEISFQNESGFTISAFIHSGSVDVIQEIKDSPPVQETEVSSNTTPEINSTTGRISSGFFLKFGVDGKGYGNWIGSLGFDFRIFKYMSLGLEIMPSYYSKTNENIPFDQTITSALTYLNIKAGTSLHFIRPQMDFIKVYGGWGGGLALSNTKATYEDTSATLFQYDPSMHMIAGFELDTGKVSLIFEYNRRRILDPDVDPDICLEYLMFGFRF